MNRYVADGMLADMREGKRVLYLGMSRNIAREVLGVLAENANTGLGEKVRRAHGAERIDSPTGGFIKLQSVGSSGRGMSVDVVVLDGEPTMRQWEDIAVLVSTGELIRA